MEERFATLESGRGVFPGTAGDPVEKDQTNKGSPEARQKKEGIARNPRKRIPTDLLQSMPKGTPHPGIRLARASRPEQGRCLAVTQKEHGQANTRSREGSQEPQEGGGCAGCRAPPRQSPTTRYPPTHVVEVGGYHAHVMQPQKGCRLDHVIVTGKDRCLCDECIDVGPVTVV